MYYPPRDGKEDGAIVGGVCQLGPEVLRGCGESSALPGLNYRLLRPVLEAGWMGVPEM